MLDPAIAGLLRRGQSKEVEFFKQPLGHKGEGRMVCES